MKPYSNMIGVLIERGNSYTYIGKIPYENEGRDQCGASTSKGEKPGQILFSLSSEEINPVNILISNF